MLRNRNSFFSESSYAQQNYVPTMTPYISAGSQQSYFGPYPNNNNFEDYESRLSKLERQINRLDARISKLENKQIESIETNTNMYML